MKISSLTLAENKALQSFSKRLLARFGPRLRTVKVFGSTVNEDRHPESDIDIIVIVDKLTFKEKRDIIDMATEINLAQDTLLSPLAMQPSEYQKLLDRERRLALDIEEKGIAI